MLLRIVVVVLELRGHLLDVQRQAADARDHAPIGRLADGDLGVVSGRLEVRELAAQADLGFRVADYLSGTTARRVW